MEILYITNKLNLKLQNGALHVSKRNFNHLKEIFNNNLELYLLNKQNYFFKVINVFCGNRLDDISMRLETEILDKIEEKKYKYIFFDGSGYGYCIERIKKKYSKIKIIVFCHDINYHLYQSLYHKAKNIKAKLLYKKYLSTSIKNEKLVYKLSDYIITLNKRDSMELKKIYNCFSNKEISVSFSTNKIIVKDIKNLKFKILFIGTGNFLPNVQGIEFFIKKILPYIDVELEIIGKGTEINREKWEKLSSKVKVRGTVESLDEYYNNVDAVIAPIYIGGGMKVKTAEALSYGKTIFGTTEAFEGYEVDYEKVGGLCNTAQEFIETITKYIEWWKNNGKPTFNEYSYQIFKEKYSYESSLKKFKEVFEELEEMEK